MSEVESESQIGQFVQQMGAKNHWAAERTAALMDHMTREHLTESNAGDIAAKAHVKSLVLYHYNSADSVDYVAAVKRHFDGAIVGSADLTRFCLDTSKTPVLQRCER